MAFTAEVRLDRSDVAARIVRGRSREVGRRGDRLGIRMETLIRGMINSELGPSSGKAADRDMVPMRSINWQHRVDNPGKFPIVAILYSDDLDGPTGIKFGALNFGAKPHGIDADKKPWLIFEGTNAWAGQIIKIKHVNHPGVTGKQWLRRVAATAGRRLI